MTLHSPHGETTGLDLSHDHSTFLFGLKQILLTDPSFTIVGEAGNGKDAMQSLVDLSPDIAVVDWDMPIINGLEITRAVKNSTLPTKVVILTMYNEESLVNEAVNSGVDGFVLKDHAIEDIIDSLRSVRDGRSYLSPAVMHHVMNHKRQVSSLLNKRPGLGKLTPAEKTVLNQVSRGLTSKEIAGELAVSPRTVETHRRNICDKLGLSGSHSLLQFAIENRALLRD